MRNQYGFFKKIKLGIWVIRSKVAYKNVRLIRFPFDIRGRKNIDLGTQLTTGVGCRFEAFSKNDTKILIFGNNVQVNDYVHISAMDSITIGDNVLMASHIYISDNSHGIYNGGTVESSPEIPPAQREYFTSPVAIGKNVWIGEGVIIMPGTEIGEGAIIGAHSVVNKSISPHTIAVGQPAKAIKRYDFELKKWVRI